MFGLSSSFVPIRVLPGPRGVAPQTVHHPGHVRASLRVYGTTQVAGASLGEDADRNEGRGETEHVSLLSGKSSHESLSRKAEK